MFAEELLHCSKKLYSGRTLARAPVHFSTTGVCDARTGFMLNVGDLSKHQYHFRSSWVILYLNNIIPPYELQSIFPSDSWTWVPEWKIY